MKKLLSIILSAVMLVSVSALSTFAFAESVNSPGQEDVDKGGVTKVVVEVNGKTSSDVKYEKDEADERVITFTYEGDGDITGWEFPGLVEGKDYIILSEDGNVITIQLKDNFDGEFTVNAIVKDEEDSESSNANKNKSNVSPKTGAVAATGIAAMGAGLAILTAAKKKENDAE